MIWWTRGVTIPLPRPCHGRALPIELRARREGEMTECPQPFFLSERGLASAFSIRARASHYNKYFLIKAYPKLGMKDFLLDIGSNRRLSAGILLAEFKMPWRDLAETSVRARAFGAGEVNLSSNSELWTSCEFSGTKS